MIVEFNFICNRLIDIKGKVKNTSLCKYVISFKRKCYCIQLNDCYIRTRKHNKTINKNSLH